MRQKIIRSLDDLVYEDNVEKVYKPGELVISKFDTFGLPPECFQNMDRTIYPQDNVKIGKDTIGMVLEHFADYHTIMYIVVWGGNLCGKKLMVTSNKIELAK